MAATKFMNVKNNIMLLFGNKLVDKLCKSLAIFLSFLCIIYILFSCHPSSYLSITTRSKWPTKYTKFPNDITNISHVVFGIAGSSNTWSNKKHYIQSWWKPNITRGFLFLDRPPNEHLPWSSSSPPYHISEDTSRYNAFDRHRMRHAIRMVRVIEETFRAENGSDVRWYVMADDDTVLFVNNLVEVLGKYDHNKYFYIGMNSECILSNAYNSFKMAFGGAGYALSYPLAKALANNLDVCIRRYPFLYGSDHILQSCVADLGISLTQERGFHQIDLHGDISGFLSSHPQSPFLSLHHLDVVDPIFPSMNRSHSVFHLVEAAKADESRLLQQTICYHKPNNWTFSISWGYSAHIYESIIPPSILQAPLETFFPWGKRVWPAYMFRTRLLSKNPCDAPHVFFFDFVEEMKGKQHFLSTYRRSSPRNLPACSYTGNHSAEYISTIRVLSPTRRYDGDGSRRECCDVVQIDRTNTTTLKLRSCDENEITP